ncbi:2-amino-4-oxopentanoate thiolase subunit OrtA [Spirillospora sp. NBC_00431]
MSEHPIPPGTRVLVRYTLLAPEERAPNLPEDTRAVPYVVRTKGILLAEAHAGEQVLVRTPTGREVAGELVLPDPADEHGFGRAHPALVRVIDEIGKLRWRGETR